MLIVLTVLELKHILILLLLLLLLQAERGFRVGSGPGQQGPAQPGSAVVAEMIPLLLLLVSLLALARARAQVLLLL